MNFVFEFKEDNFVFAFYIESAWSTAVRQDLLPKMAIFLKQFGYVFMYIVYKIFIIIER